MYNNDKNLWILVLNKYQRDNLLWLLEVIGNHAKQVEPFHLANTGDWVGELLNYLGSYDPEPAQPGDGLGVVGRRTPNSSRGALEESVKAWLKTLRFEKK